MVLKSNAKNWLNKNPNLEKVLITLSPKILSQFQRIPNWKIQVTYELQKLGVSYADTKKIVGISRDKISEVKKICGIINDKRGRKPKSKTKIVVKPNSQKEIDNFIENSENPLNYYGLTIEDLQPLPQSMKIYVIASLLDNKGYARNSKDAIQRIYNWAKNELEAKQK